MTKQELNELLHGIGCPVNEGVSSLKNEKTFPRIDWWEIAWEDEMASGEDYSEKVTHQISFYATRPRDPKLLELRNILREHGEHPVVSHEYNVEDRIWHSYFAVETYGECADG